MSRELVRVSVSARVIMHIEGRLLLCVSINGIKKRGKRELWPFGGGISVEQHALEDLTTRFAASEFEGDEKDLRFKLPKGNLLEFQRCSSSSLQGKSA